MKKLFVSLFACAAFGVGSSLAAPMTFNFSQGGFDGDGRVTGTFTAEDLNGDGQISSFDGEVFDASGEYSGGAFVDGFSFGFEDLFGLVYDLDGTIGDGIDGDIEGIAFSTFDNEYAAGPGPFALCGGDAICGLVTDFLFDDFSTELVMVTPAVGDPIPLPGAMVLFGSVLAGGGALRMRRAKA